MPSLLLVCSDLLLGSKVTAAAREAEFDLTRTLSQKRGVEKLAERPFDVVVLDLEIEPLDAAAMIAAAGDAKAVAFVSHVKTDLIDAGRAAGWAVMTRGQMASSGAAALAQIARSLEEPAP